MNNHSSMIATSLTFLFDLSSLTFSILLAYGSRNLANSLVKGIIKDRSKRNGDWLDFWIDIGKYTTIFFGYSTFFVSLSFIAMNPITRSLVNGVYCTMKNFIINKH